MSTLKAPETPVISASSIMAQLSPAAVQVGEAVIQEIINAAMPKLSTIAWAWYNHQAVSGFFGWAEHSLLGPVFTGLFGPNPGVVTGIAPATTTTAS